MTPFGINKISDMFVPHSITQWSDRVWYQTVALSYPHTTITRVRAAWWVLTGKAQAVIWPRKGELELTVKKLGLRLTERNEP